MTTSATIATPALHLCIATGQNLANLIPALQCGAREVWVLQTPSMRVSAAHLCDALKARDIAVRTIDFPDDDVKTLHAQAEKIAASLVGRAVTINITGGTKLMTLALTDTLAELLTDDGDAAKPHLVYTDTLRHRLDWLRPTPRSEAMVDVLRIDDILLAQGYRRKAGLDGAAAAAQQRSVHHRKWLTGSLAREAVTIGNGFAKLNKAADLALEDIDDKRGPFHPEQDIGFPNNKREADVLRDVLQRIAKLGGLLHWDGKQRVNFQSEGAARYIRGGWLEEYAAQEIKTLSRSNHAAALEVEGVQGDAEKTSTENELDALMVHGNRMLVVECKTANTREEGKPADWIYKLNQVARTVGGQMARPLLLSARAIGDLHRQRAREYGVDILAAAELAALPDYLRRWMAG